MVDRIASVKRRLASTLNEADIENDSVDYYVSLELLPAPPPQKGAIPSIRIVLACDVGPHKQIHFSVSFLKLPDAKQENVIETLVGDYLKSLAEAREKAWKGTGLS